jgi:DNA-binding NarL/FixJ family response regulator
MPAIFSGFLLPFLCPRKMEMAQKEKLNVLIVDDSKIITTRIRNMLAGIKNINVIGEAMNYIEAMDIIRHHAPDVVLLDINLPGKSGVDILKEVKQTYKNIKVIMLTNHSEPLYRTLCKKAGSDYFFDKSAEFEKVPEVLISLFNARTK